MQQAVIFRLSLVNIARKHKRRLVSLLSPDLWFVRKLSYEFRTVLILTHCLSGHHVHGWGMGWRWTQSVAYIGAGGASGIGSCSGPRPPSGPPASSPGPFIQGCPPQSSLPRYFWLFITKHFRQKYINPTPTSCGFFLNDWLHLPFLQEFISVSEFSRSISKCNHCVSRRFS